MQRLETENGDLNPDGAQPTYWSKRRGNHLPAHLDVGRSFRVHNEDLRQRLAGLFAFATQAPAELLDAVLDRSSLTRFRKGALVFEPGDASEAYPLVLSGSLRIVVLGEQGREVLLYRLGVGQGCPIACGCLVARRPICVGCVAETDVELLKVPREVFHRLMQESPGFRDHVCELLAESLLELTRMTAALSFYRVDQRLAALLLHRGPGIRATHEELAHELGTVREIVGRILGEFSHRGAVILRRGHIEVTDFAPLRAIAGGLV